MSDPSKSPIVLKFLETHTDPWLKDVAVYKALHHMLIYFPTLKFKDLKNYPQNSHRKVTNSETPAKSVKLPHMPKSHTPAHAKTCHDGQRLRRNLATQLHSPSCHPGGQSAMCCKVVEGVELVGWGLNFLESHDGFLLVSVSFGSCRFVKPWQIQNTKCQVKTNYILFVHVWLANCSFYFFLRRL